jgi:hypothetical protein
MDLRTFAEKHRLRVRRDEDNCQIIPGKDGHIWDYGDGLFGVTLLELTPMKWGYRRNACLRAGMELHQDGDSEGTCLFDPTDSEQVRVALKVAQVKRKRRVSPEQLERLREMAAHRRKRIHAPQEATLTAQNARTGHDVGSGKGGDVLEEKDAQAEAA